MAPYPAYGSAVEGGSGMLTLAVRKGTEPASVLTSPKNSVPLRKIP